MIEYHNGVPIPEMGDLINYFENGCSWANALVTNTDDRGGYSDIYLNNLPKSMFNINHHTGKASTQHSQGGWWEFATEVPKVREWQVPAEPTDCKRVIATDGTDEVYTYEPIAPAYAWVQKSSGSRFSWVDLLDHHAGVREYVKTDYEAAVEWFRVLPLRLQNLTAQTNHKHASAIIAHVIGEK